MLDTAKLSAATSLPSTSARLKQPNHLGFYSQIWYHKIYLFAQKTFQVKTVSIVFFICIRFVQHIFYIYLIAFIHVSFIVS